MPVRRLIQKLPNLLPRLKPCWLMSPMSVAQYIDPTLPPFDLVVFDEASQIPAWDAVGALARGAEAVIVGDSKQLPPTNFFSRQDDDEPEDDNDFEELESILDEAVASDLPSLALLWHYRSRHESLIAFSNYHYYGNRLLTFPSPEQHVPGLGVSLRHLPEGRYDRSKSKTNRAEAEAIVAEIVRRLEAAGDKDVSIGVVTFSVAQQYLVEDLLEEQRRRKPALERFFASGAAEPVFIKNLENVQGDERDVILFSICYGPDQAGKVSMGFGPLNRLGGERRLNVAITRARRELIVFSSIRTEQIDLARTRALGVQHLKVFLDYAARGPQALAEAQEPGLETESPFEESVRQAIVARGWEVDVQIGCSGYRIDLAVKDPQRPGRYLLGIECDGATYHRARSARDRDRLREQILVGLGWKIHRVWSTDWLQSPANALARIEEALRIASTVGPDDSTSHQIATQPAHELRFESQSGQPSLASPTELFPVETAPMGAQICVPYRRHRLAPGNRSPEAFFDGVNVQRVMSDVADIVNAESPIHRDLLLSRTTEGWGVERVTTRCSDHFDSIISRLKRRGALRVEGQIVWSPSQTPDQFRNIRIPASDDMDARAVDHIPPVEVANGAAAVLAQQISLPIAALRREVGHLFGVQRLTSRLEAFFDVGIKVLEKRGGCVIEDGHVSVR